MSPDLSYKIHSDSINYTVMGCFNFFLNQPKNPCFFIAALFHPMEIF